MTTLSPLGEAALGYAAIGWPIFPCRPKGKEPIGAAVPHGVKNATTDPDRIRRWWHRWPNANPAVACGAPGPDVLDVDTKDGRSGQDLFRRAWRAGLLRGSSATILTPSGGRHFWYAGTDQRGAAVGRDKALELKAVGGYVLLPPSRVVSEDYGYDGIYQLIEQSEHEAPINFAAVKQYLDPAPTPIRRIRPRLADGTVSPGDAYNQQYEWADLLLPHGWTFAGQRGQISYWRRPGKTEGISASTNALGTDRLKVFTTSTDFEPESYSKFGALAVLEFGGDLRATARHLRAVGFGTSREMPVAA